MDQPSVSPAPLLLGKGVCQERFRGAFESLCDQDSRTALGRWLPTSSRASWLGEAQQGHTAE